MDEVTGRCPSCGRQRRVDRGVVFRCDACGVLLRVPQSSEPLIAPISESPADAFPDEMTAPAWSTDELNLGLPGTRSHHDPWTATASLDPITDYETEHAHLLCFKCKKIPGSSADCLCAVEALQ